MLRFLALLFVFISANARRYYRRTRNYCYFRRAGKRVRFQRSDTTFNIRNTFLQVETTLTARSAGWWRYYGTSRGFFAYWLPSEAIVSSLRLKVKDRITGQTEWFNGYVKTNAEAIQDFNQKFGGRNKAQLIFRWTNEQFAKVVLRTRMKNRDIISIAVGWQYALELQFDRFTFAFPIPLPGADSRSVLTVNGTIVEDGRPINSITVESPGPIDLHNGLIVEPSCERVVNATTKVPCDTRIDVNRVEIFYEVTYGQYRYWLSQRKQYRYPFWYYYQTWKQCIKPKKHGSQSTSSSGGYYRGRNNLWKARYASNIAHDLVFSVSYNHTLDPTRFFGVPPFYGGPLDDFVVNWVWGGDNDTCWMVGLSAEEIFRDVQPPIQFDPVVRRATFFLDDNTGVTKEYYDKIKQAIIRILTEASQVRLANLQSFGNLLDNRNFDEFRIVVLSSNGNVYQFPNVAATQVNKFINANATTVSDAINFLTNDIPDPPECQVLPGFRFRDTKIEFLRVMQEYIDLAISLGALGRVELSDVFMFSNSKPEGTNGNFARGARYLFLSEIKAKQDALRAFTTRTYGQPIFTFGFGPNADFNLLNAMSANNFGATTMAFEDDSAETVDVQAFQFYRGIGRVLMSAVKITSFQAVYGTNGEADLITGALGRSLLDVNTSLSDSGMTIPILRDSMHFNIFLEAPPFFEGKPIVGFIWSQDFIPGGEFTQANSEIFPPTLFNRTRALIVRPGDPRFGTATDKLNLTANWDDISLCKYGNVVRVQTFEKALRLQRNYPDLVSKSESELVSLIEAAGLKGDLQTSETSFVVAELGELKETDPTDSQAYTQPSTNGSGFGMDVRLGLFVTMIVFCVVFFF